MPRKRSTLGIAAGKLLMAIQKESTVATDEEQVLANKIAKRAQTLLQAAHQDYVLGLLNGKTVAEYLDAQWVAAHADVQQCVDAVTTELQQPR